MIFRDILGALVLFLLFLIGSLSYGQNLHYSQFFYSPLNLNPALTGSIDGDWRFITNYRSQGQYFSEPLNTISLSFDKAISLYKDHSGVGFLYTRDYSWGLSVPSDRFYLSIASSVKASPKSIVAMGVQVGWLSRMFSYDNMTFPEQYDRDVGDFNESLPISEDFQNSSSNYFDVNAGLLWNYSMNHHLLSVGCATYHINTPKDNFLEEETTVSIRFNWHASFRYTISDDFYLLPRSYVTVQNKMSETVMGTNVGFRSSILNEYVNNFDVGAYYKNGFNNNVSSIIFLLGASMKNWSTAISFDIDISGAKDEYLLNDAVELSIIYKRPSSKLTKVSVPCIRY